MYFKLIKYYFSLAIIVLLTISCDHKKTNNDPKQEYTKEEIEESLFKANQQLVNSEDEQIADFLSRYNWDMRKTESGLRYFIYHQGTGLRAENGVQVMISYNVRLLTGDLIYSSEKDGVYEFVIGKSTAESGLEEGVLLMRVGDKAKLIIPSHLAFGLLGDQNRIPKRATLVYDLELLDIKNKILN